MGTRFERSILWALAMGSILAGLLAAPVVVSAHGENGGVDLGLDGITIDAATVSRIGLVTVAGSITCSNDLEGVEVGVELAQVVGRFNTIQGGGWTTIDCVADEGTAAFSISFYPYEGKFAPGNARLAGYASIYTCTEEECLFDSVETGQLQIRLRR